MEIRNPATASPTSSASRSISKAKTPAKESSLKKGKKKANIGAGGIEEVAGSLGVGVSKSPTLVEQEPATESGPTTRVQAAGKNKDSMIQDNDDNDDMYATEEDDCGDEGGGDETLEASVGGQEEGIDVNPDLPPREKRKPTRDDKEKSAVRHVESPMATATTSMSTTPAIAAEPNIAQGQHQQGTTPTGHGISMAIDPALEALHTPNT